MYILILQIVYYSLGIICYSIQAINGVISKREK